MNESLANLVRATLKIKEVNDKDGCVPDYVIQELNSTLKIPDTTLRSVRDIVQEK